MFLHLLMYDVGRMLLTFALCELININLTLKDRSFSILFSGCYVIQILERFLRPPRIIRDGCTFDVLFQVNAPT